MHWKELMYFATTYGPRPGSVLDNMALGSGLGNMAQGSGLDNMAMDNMDEYQTHIIARKTKIMLQQ